MNTYETIDLNDYVQTGEGGTSLTYNHKDGKTLAKLFLASMAAENAIREFRMSPSMEHRIKRVMRRQNVSEQEARDIIAMMDTTREAYIKKYEDTSRYDTRNYQLVISMDDLSEDDAAEVIMDDINRTSK